MVAVLLVLACLVETAQVGAGVRAPEEEWSKTFGGNEKERAYSIIQTSDGGYAVAGYTDSKDAGHDSWAMKLDKDGNIVWKKIFGESTSNYYVYSIIQTSDGGYAVAGSTCSKDTGCDPWVIKCDPGVIKLDENGNIVWDKTFDYPTTYSNILYSIVQTSDGGYVVAGHTGPSREGSSFYNGLVIKLDEYGNKVWDETFVGNYDTYDYTMAYSIIQTSDRGYAVAGKIKMKNVISVSEDSWDKDKNTQVITYDEAKEYACVIKLEGKDVPVEEKSGVEIIPVPETAQSNKSTSTSTSEEERTPGFGAISSIAMLLTVAYLLKRG